jgi:Polyketide cyclase / dehydrase and lipid transport
VITFETNVRIDRPVEEVFAHVSEPLNFPHWNSAVETTRKTSAGERRRRLQVVTERELPTSPRCSARDRHAAKPAAHLHFQAALNARPGRTGCGTSSARRYSVVPAQPW